MGYRRDRVVILKKEIVRDHDRRYTLYGREHGFCVAFVRGASRLHSKQAGHLEPFSDAEVMLADGRYFDHLAVASRSNAYRVQRLVPVLLLGRFSDLVARLLRPGVADARIFDLIIEFRDAVSQLPEDASQERGRYLLSAGILRFLDLLGFAPPFEDPEEREKWEMEEGHLFMLRRLRHEPLHDALRITAPRDALVFLSQYIEHGLYTTPLEDDFRGTDIIDALRLYANV